MNKQLHTVNFIIPLPLRFFNLSGKKTISSIGQIPRTSPSWKTELLWKLFVITSSFTSASLLLSAINLQNIYNYFYS